MSKGTSRLTLEHIFQSEAYVEGSYGPLAIAVWEGRGSVDQAERAARMLSVVAARSSDPIFAIAVLGPEVPPPDGELREVMTNAVQRLGPRFGAIANVVEGTGFRAAAMRGVLVGMVLLIRPIHPQTVCVTVAEAAAFIAKHSREALRAEGIVHAIRTLRQRE